MKTKCQWCFQPTWEWCQDHTHLSKRNKVEYTLHFQFKATNNEADYEALLARIRLTHDLRAKQLSALSDSMLIINQVNNTYQVKGKAMEAYLVKA